MSRRAHSLRVVEAALMRALATRLLSALPFRLVARLAGRVEPSVDVCPPPTADASAKGGDRAVAAVARRLSWGPP